MGEMLSSFKVFEQGSEDFGVLWELFIEEKQAKLLKAKILPIVYLQTFQMLKKVVRSQAEMLLFYDALNEASGVMVFVNFPKKASKDIRVDIPVFFLLSLLSTIISYYFLGYFTFVGQKPGVSMIEIFFQYLMGSMLFVCIGVWSRWAERTIALIWWLRVIVRQILIIRRIKVLKGSLLAESIVIQ